MRNLLLRILIMIIFLPVIWVMLFILPHYNHLVFNCAVFIVSLLATLEVENFFIKKQMSTWKHVTPFLGVTLPVYSFLEISGLVPRGYFLHFIVLLAILIFIRGTITASEKTLKLRLEFFSTSILVLIYPGLFISYIVRITDTAVFGSQPQFAMLVFCSLVFANDIMAYIAGMILGKYSRLNLLISPKKSLAGFIAGFLTSLGVALLSSIFLKDIFILSWQAALALGSVIGLATIAGDLLESVMKRSCELKDSGALMAGRGGLMDTIDSLLLSAPVFYLIFPLLIQ